MSERGSPIVPDPLPEIQVLSPETSPTIPNMVLAGGTARALIWPGMGASARSLHLIELDPGGETQQMRHASEAVYYVLQGEAAVTDLDVGRAHRVPEGGIIFVEPETTYVLSGSGRPTEIVGGPCPADPRLYEGMDRA
jgi:mannose-6-phosphate isomerase-like protein (cupin superfamily)